MSAARSRVRISKVLAARALGAFAAEMRLSPAMVAATNGVSFASRHIAGKPSNRRKWSTPAM